MVEDLPEAKVNELSLKHETHRETNDERHQRKQYTYLLARRHGLLNFKTTKITLQVQDS